MRESWTSLSGQLEEALNREDALRARVAELEDTEARLRNALERIVRWDGEFPETGQFWDETTKLRPVSYGAAYGSNGERDFMRSIARAALEVKP